MAVSGVDRLRELYEKQAVHGAIFDVHPFFEMGAEARGLALTRTGGRRLLAFLLSLIFLDFAQKFEGVPITATLSRELFSKLDKPVRAVLEHLVAEPEADAVADIMLRLVNAYLELPPVRA